MQMMPRHILRPIVDCYSLYATEVIRIQTVLRRIGKRVTSGHVTKMAVTPFDPQLPKTPCCTQTSRLHFLYNRSYCPLNFYIVGIRNFRIFAKNNGK